MKMKTIMEKTMNKTKLPAKILTGLAITLFVCGTARPSSHDVAWTFGNVGFSSYRLDAVAPEDADLGAAIGQEDPTLNLQVGKRYKVTVINYVVHPFEVLAKGSSASRDVVLLSMNGSAAPFESDPQVNWMDNGLGEVTFTLTAALFDSMQDSGNRPGYRCRAHPFSMRGNFNVSLPPEPEPQPIEDPIPEPIEKGSIRIDLQLIASGLTAPVHLTHADDGTDRLFVVDQPGRVLIIENGRLLSTPFLDITERVFMPGVRGTQDVNDFDERGFLGLAFHPDFADPQSPGYRKLYTYSSQMVLLTADFTTPPLPEGVDFDHQSVITEWTVDVNNPNVVDVDTRREIIRINEPQFNHNAGMLAFGPDGHLYIGVGDGGGSNDNDDGHGPNGNGQNKNTVHGSILRIDPLDPMTTVSINHPSDNGKYRIPVDNPFLFEDGADEIYAYGFRNPWRFGFDPLTGDLVAADVGQNQIEEIDIVQPAGNYGWNLKEGTFGFDPEDGTVHNPSDDLPDDLIDPVAQYDHDEGISITGGFVYRGLQIPELSGKYVFGDFSSSFSLADGRLFYADLQTGLIEEFVLGVDDRSLALYVKSFGRDADGELYLLAGPALGPFGDTGMVFKIVPLQTQFTADLSASPAGTDSSATGQADLRVNPDGDLISYQLNVQNIENVTMAHIHVSDTPGGNGPPAVWLYPSAPPAQLKPGSFTGVLNEGDITADNLVGPLEGMTIGDLVKAIRENRAYVNVHTEQFPAGEIRGLVAAVPPGPPVGAELTGAAAGTDSAAAGQTLLNVNSSGDLIAYKLNVQGIRNVTMAHIHIADQPAGDGPPAVWLYPPQPPAQLIPGLFNGLLGQGSFSETDLVGPLAGMTLDDLLTAIEENRAYVNVHTEQFPAGEIRGQLK
jgi:glucose/arabinose dehydrogenase